MPFDSVAFCFPTPGAVTFLEFQIHAGEANAMTLPWLGYAAFHLGDHAKALQVGSGWVGTAWQHQCVGGWMAFRFAFALLYMTDDLDRLVQIRNTHQPTNRPGESRLNDTDAKTSTPRKYICILPHTSLACPPSRCCSCPHSVTPSTQTPHTHKHTTQTHAHTRQTYRTLFSKDKNADPVFHLWAACCLYYLEQYKEAEQEALLGPPNRMQNRILFHCAFKQVVVASVCVCECGSE